MGSEVDEPGERRAVKRLHVLLADDAADAAEIVAHARRVARHAVAHLRLDAEELGEAVVGIEQALVEVLVADEDDLEIEGHGQGPQALGAHGRVRDVGVVLEPRGAGLEGAHEALPGSRVLHEIVHVQDEEPAVGAVDAAGRDEGEVRDQGAELAFALDAAQEVGRSGVILYDNGRALRFGVVHEDVAPVAGAHRVPRGLRLPGILASVRLGLGIGLPADEGIRIFEDVLPEILEEAGERGAVRDLLHALAQRLEHGVEHGAHGRFLENLLLVHVSLFHLCEGVYEAGHMLRHSLAPVLQGDADTRVETLEVVLGHAAPLHERIERHVSGLVDVEAEALVLGHVVHAVDELGALDLVVGQKLLTLFREALAREAAVHVPVNVPDAFLHGLAEAASLSRGKRDERRAVRGLEVVDVDEIRRRGGFPGHGPQVLGEHVLAPEIGVAREVDVEAAASDVQGHVEGLHGPVLDGRAPLHGSRTYSGAVVRGNEGGIVGGVKLGRRERIYSCHGIRALIAVPGEKKAG